MTQKIFFSKTSVWRQMKENFQIYLPYQFCPRVQSARWDPQLPNKKLKTTTFFPMRFNQSPTWPDSCKYFFNINNSLEKNDDMHLFSFILFDVCQISFRRFWQILAIFAYFQGAITCFSNHNLDTFPVSKVGQGLWNY